MSVLSSSWRYVWASNPTLIFPRSFCARRKMLGTLESTISEILWQHRGAIKKFHLDISFIADTSLVDEWVLWLSRNGIVHLTLGNGDLSKLASAPYELPSILYEVELEYLRLSNCIFRPPSSIRSFHKLKILLLKGVSFKFYAETFSLWMPQLVILGLVECTGIRHLKIYAPELEHLDLLGSSTDTLKLSNFIHCGKLEDVRIFFNGQDSLNSQGKTVKLSNLLSSWCNVIALAFDDYFLKFFGSGTGAVERLPVTLNRLTILRIICNLDEEHLISLLLCILRSSPNLKLLSIVLRDECDLKVDVNYFEGSELNLQTLHIEKFHGSRNEMSFVRFIIASAPSLRKAILLTYKPVEGSDKKLMQFPRASPKLKIMYKPWSRRVPYYRLLVYGPYPIEFGN